MTQTAHAEDLTFVRWLTSDQATAPELSDPDLAQVAIVIAPLHGQERIAACQIELEASVNGRGPEIWDRLTRAMAELDKPTEDQPSWEVFTLADAYKPRPPRVYAVSGLFPLPSLSIVYGAPGTFKSMLLAEMCACVAAGMPWLQPLPDKDDVTPISTTAVPALWCDFDNGRRRTHERIDAIGRAYELSEVTPLYYVSMPDPWLDINAEGAVAFMVGLIGELGAKLVVIDNLGTVSGRVDENSTEMVQVMSRFRRIAEESGAAMVLIHHQRKMTGLSSRKGETLRGSSSIEAALDLALLVEREEHAETVQMRSTKVRGADVLPFAAMFTYEHEQGTDELAQVRFFGLPVEDVVSDAAIDRHAIEVLGATPQMNKGDLKAAIKARLPNVGINRIGNRLDYIASRGDLVLALSDRGAKLYSVPVNKNESHSFTALQQGDISL